ncbi:MAG: o-succinylbenzoate synthase [Thermaerobacter sp.]|nr:o-succinylbenzoate synthase [Thermaerobacter sp.]
MQLRRIELFALQMRLRHPFETSFGREEEREFLLVRAQTDDFVGWGEVTVSRDPFYSYETLETAESVLRNYLIPWTLSAPIAHPDDLLPRLGQVRGHQMAKAGLEGALWDLYAQEQGLPLYRALGGERREIEVGISIGIEPTVDLLLQQVERFLGEGYRRIKIKIKPGQDYEPLRAVRDRFGNIPMMADANSAYRLSDIGLLQRLDELGLMMIEQPLGYDDIIDHAKLSPQLRTPICLDESIHGPDDARKAIELRAAGILNIKIGRLGGLGPARKTHDIAREAGIPVWCGGMLESGVGRLHNVAITTLPGFTLPGDTAASRRYWEEDIVEPEVEVTPQGTIVVPQTPGIGSAVREDRVRALAHGHWTYRP